MPRVVHARDCRFGGYLEDFEVGDVFHHWPGKTITEAEVHQFCMLTFAASPVHIDACYASREMEHGRNLVVGTYIYSLLLGMSVPDVSGRAIANLGAEHLRHVAPLYYGDTIYGSTQVTGTRVSRSRPGAGILTVETTGSNQDGLVVCVFERSILVPRGPIRPVEPTDDPADSARDTAR